MRTSGASDLFFDFAFQCVAVVVDPLIEPRFFQLLDCTCATARTLTKNKHRSVLTPTSYEYDYEKLFFQDPEIIDFWGLGGPGGPRNHSKGGVLRASPPGPSRPQNR